MSVDMAVRVEQHRYIHGSFPQQCGFCDDEQVLHQLRLKTHKLEIELAEIKKIVNEKS